MVLEAASPRSRRWLIQCLLRAYSRACRQLPSCWGLTFLPLVGARGQREALKSLPLPVRARTPGQGPRPHSHTYPSRWGLGLQHMAWVGGGHIQSLTLVRTWTGCLSSSWHRPEWFSSGDGPPALPSGFTEGSPPGSPASEHWVLPGHGVTRSGPGAPSSLRICACGLAAFLESPQNTKCLPTRLPHCPVPGAAFCPSCAFGVCVWGGDGNLQ